MERYQRRTARHLCDPRPGSGAICLNGAAARKAQVGDVLIIASYARMEFEEAKTFRPWVVFPDTATNRLVE